MKKFICALTVLFLMLSLCSCGTVNKSVGFSQGPWQALSVEIYFLEETYRTPDARNIRNENTPLCVIDSTTSDGGEATSALMNEIPSLPFTMEVMYFPAPVDWDYLFEGYVICVVYPDGYDIIAQQGQLYYSVNKNGKEKYNYGHSDYVGEVEWSSIIQKYITAQ